MKRTIRLRGMNGVLKGRTWEATARGQQERARTYNEGTWPRAERVKRLFGSWSKAQLRLRLRVQSPTAIGS